MKTFMFPGQGSQSKGMGGDLFDEFDKLTEKADKILGYSIKELCLEDPDSCLGQTQYTQPALYVVNALSYYKKTEKGDVPDYVVGHSLGEFNALLAAGCYDFEAGLKIVKRRGELMSEAAGGGMAAIINATRDEIEEILKANKLSSIDLANFNTQSQIVISGLKDDIVKAQSFFQSGKMLYYPLNTSGAFHSRHMEPAKAKFETYLKKFKFSAPEIPVIANVTARPYEDDAIVDNLSTQIAASVRWEESIQYLLGLGEMEFVEVGHGDVLTKLVHKIRRDKPAKAAPEPKGAVPEVEDRKSSKKSSSKDAAPELNGTRPNEVKEFKLEGSSAEEKVKHWNSSFSIGTRVRCLDSSYEDLETRTEAVVLFGHRAAIYMKGYNGYFDLNEIEPLQ